MFRESLKLHVTKDHIYGFFIILLTFPHLKTDFFNQSLVWDSLFNFGRILSFCIIFFWYFFIRKKISKLMALFLVMESYVAINTFLQGRAMQACLISVFSVLSIAMLYDMYSDNREIFISAQLFCFEIFIYINFFSEILFPEGLYQGILYSKNWFLGYYNTHTRYFLPALLFAYLYAYETGKKIRTIILTIVIYLSALIAWSGGILVSLIGMALVYIFFKNRTTIFNYINYWLIHLVFFIGIILLHMQNLFRWLIEDILGKWGSLEGRMLAWNNELYYIGESIVFGYGIEEGTERMIQYHFWASHSHNLLLEIFHQGGIIYFLLFVVIILVAGRKVLKYKCKEPCKIVATVFLGWCLHSLVEPYLTALLMGMFMVAYHCMDEFYEQKGEESNITGMLENEKDN